MRLIGLFILLATSSCGPNAAWIRESATPGDYRADRATCYKQALKVKDGDLAQAKEFSLCMYGLGWQMLELPLEP